MVLSNKKMPLFTLNPVVPNPYDLLSSVKLEINVSHESPFTFTASFLPAMKMNGD